ncbi:MAG: hydrophobe/amphiphile efflux-3 (HAE3) family transporter [Methanomicrobiales archaeon]|nr:hydrophobe/amphiphile efflux-3 (HAE3) family transporter [Methanomicrobiales archaeon]
MNVEDLFGRVANVVNHYPKAIIVVMLVLAVIAIIFMATIPPQTESDEFMNKHSPSGMVYDIYNNRYGQDSYVLLITASNPTDPGLLRELLVLEKQVKRINHVSSAVSIADVVAEYHGGTIPGTKAEVDEIIDKLPPDIRKQFVPDKETALAYVLIDQGVSTDASQNVEPFVVKTIGQASLPPGVSVKLTGNTPFNIQLQEAMLGNFSVLILASMAFMLLVLGLLFSKIRFWILPIILLTFGLFYTFGIMGILGIPANDGAVAAFPILLGLGIDYAVQFHSRFDDERRRSDSASALTETIKKTGPAVLIALGATSLGFAAMFITPIPMIQTFATVSILGIVCCYLTSLFGFGAFALLLRYEPKPPGKSITERMMTSYDALLSRVAAGVVKVAMPVILVAVVIAAVGLTMDPGIPVNTSSKSMGPADLPAQLVADQVQSVTGSLAPLPLYISGINTKTVGGIWWTDRLSTEMAGNYYQISGISSISSLVRSYNNGVLPVNQVDLDRVLATIPAAEKNLYQLDDATSVISIETISMSINEQRAFSDNVVKDVAWLEPPPGANIIPTGDFTLYTILTDQIVANKDKMTFIGFALIFIFLLLVYRKGIAVTPIIPLICVIGWNPLAMIALGQNYSIMTAVLGSMTIGVGSEYTILVMERYLEEYARSGDRIGAIREAVRKIGTAVSVSGLVTAAGFSELMLSSFPVLSGFGLATVIVVIFSLVGAIVIMPATLALMGGLGKKQARLTGAVESSP